MNGAGLMRLMRDRCRGKSGPRRSTGTQLSGEKGQENRQRQEVENKTQGDFTVSN